MQKTRIVSLLIVAVFAFPIGCATSTKKGPSNPTERGGRGAPDLEALNRPAAWIYIDGLEGRFTERDGKPWLQWIIDGPVSQSPTFRVEVYEPLIGSPKDFQCVLQTRDSDDGSMILYAIRANPGTFEIGKEYSLLKPGENFVILDKTAGQGVEEIPLLTPGTYGIAAGIKNAETEKEALAVTDFTVGESTPVAAPPAEAAE